MRSRRRAPAPAAGWRRLRAGDLPLLARVLALWPAAAVLKWALPLPHLGRAFSLAPGPAPDPDRAAWLTGAVLRRAYRRRPGYCVERSLVLFRLLQRGPHAVRLCFGVRRAGGRLSGHAWVTLDGRPFAEAADPGASYTPTYVYPPDA